jgi:acetyl-CoA C-acetyltransferase
MRHPGTPALTLNRLCGSGFQAIVSAAQNVLLGDADCALAGGVESMSRGGYLQPACVGAHMGETKNLDMMVGADRSVRYGAHGNHRRGTWPRNGTFRAAADAFALQSQQRAAKAIAEGRQNQILAVELKTRKAQCYSIPTNT